MANSAHDENSVATLIAVSNADGTTPVRIYADPTTHRLLVDSASAMGTVTSVSVVSANGFAGTVANATTTPAITLTTTITGVLKGNGTAISAATAGSDYAVGSIGLSGGQTIAGGTLTTQNLTLRANAADTTTGSVAITTSTTSTTTTTGALTVAGGLGVAGAINSTDLTVTNTITGSITGNAGTATALQNARTIGGVSFNGTANITVASATGGFTVSGGNLTVSAINIVTDTSTGTKIGTATNQKLGFFNSAPIVQPTGDVITALQNLGLGASLTVAATTITSRTLWGQTYDGSANVSGSLTAVGDITGGASNMAITAGTGNSRTLTLKSTTSGGTATAFITGNADQSTTFGGNISGTGAWTLTGGAGNMTIVSGTGNSRTMILQTTTSGGTATTALTLNADQSATFAAGLTATTHNGLTITTTTGTFTLTNAKTLTVSDSTTLATNAITLGGGEVITFSASNALSLLTSGTTVMTFPAATDTVAVLGTAQTYTATMTEKQVVWSNNAITASGNAATVPITSRLNTVTNNSAATLTITMTTTSAVDGQLSMVRVLDFSGVAQTITWVNTENSTVSVPTTSNGSTTLPLTVGFQYNGGTSKWRCIASA